jgi:hypothetical protein
MRIARITLLAAAISATSWNSRPARAAGDAGTVAPAPDFSAELARMRADLAEIRRARDESWLDAQRAEEVRALVRDVLADSSVRSQWSGSPLVTGYDQARGFYLGLDDQGQSIRAFGFGQVRFVWNDGYDAAERTPAADDVWGAEVRRVQLFVTGTIGGPDLTWLIGLSVGSWNDPVNLQGIRANPRVVNGSPPQISYLTVTKQLGDGWYLQVGNVFTPFTYESHLFSTAETQMGECSMLEWLFTAAFTTGASVGWDGDSVRWQAVVGDQVGTGPGAWNAAVNQSIAATGRLNWKLCGTWEQYALETSFPGQPFGAFVGLAGQYQNGRAINPASSGGVNPRAVTADLALMFGGANLILQGIWADQWIDRDEQSWGGLVQGGVFLGPAVEAFTSWGIADVGGTQSRINVGANWYLDGQALKLTGMVIVPLTSIPGNAATAVLPPQGLGGGADPNNNLSVVLQLQAEF